MGRETTYHLTLDQLWKLAGQGTSGANEALAEAKEINENSGEAIIFLTTDHNFTYNRFSVFDGNNISNFDIL